MGSAFLEKNIIVAGERVTNANSGFDESGFAQVNITLDMQGGRAMQKPPMATLVDDWCSIC